MQVLIFTESNLQGEIKDIPNTLESLQKEIGGYIQTVNFVFQDKDYVIILDEERLIKNRPVTKYFRGHWFVGNLIICALDGFDEFEGITDDEAEKLKSLFKSREKTESARLHIMERHPNYYNKSMQEGAGK